MTAKAFALARPCLPPSPTVVDMGCGTGTQTLELAGLMRQLPGRPRVIGVDSNPEFILSLRERAEKEKLSGLLEAKEGDITRAGGLGLAPASCDLIWAEGSLYIAGFETGLKEWKTLLKAPENDRPGGLVAATELSWLAPDPRRSNPTAWDFWQKNYPDMRGVEENTLRLEKAGYSLIAAFPLEKEAWDNYYRPLSAHLAEMRKRSGGGLADEAVIDGLQEEIDLYATDGDSYGYVFYIAARA